MDRLPPISPESMTEAQKAAVQELMAGRRGGPRGPFIALLRSPEFMSRLQKTGEYLRYDCALGRKLTELVILLTAHHWTQAYEWQVHYPLALQEGLRRDLLDAIAEDRQPADMAGDEQIVYDFCRELHQNRGVSDATYTRAVQAFGEQGVVDMTGLCGYYSALAMILNVAQTSAPGAG